LGLPHVCTVPRCHRKFPPSPDEEPSHRVLIPFQAYAGPLRHQGVAVFDLDGLLEDRARVVQILQDVGGGTRGEQVGAHLGERVTREREAGGLGECRRPQPGPSVWAMVRS
jgi:hypothetical protein